LTPTAPAASERTDTLAHARAAELASGRSRAGRPTAERVEAINQAILDAAREHFLASGFEATPMEAVAASANISKGTLYARYPTKEALLRAVVEAQVEAWRALDARRRPPAPPADLQAKLRHHARRIVEALGSEQVRDFEALVRGAGPPGCELARVLHETGYRMAITALAGHIAEGTRKDAAPARDPERVAEMLMAMLYGWHGANETVRRVRPAEARAFADSAVRLLFAGRAGW
jgi:AcrR family transcriptional regulator